MDLDLKVIKQTQFIIEITGVHVYWLCDAISGTLLHVHGLSFKTDYWNHFTVEIIH